MEQWLSLISDVGFPAVVTLYLLHRIERKLDTLNQSIVMLPERIKERPLAVSDELSTMKSRSQI